MIKAMQLALDYLARRDYSSYELGQKLMQRFAQAEVEQVLAACIRQGLLCEQRFVESRVRHRLQQGYGPLWITQELRQHGIVEDLITEALPQTAEEWFAQIHRLVHKKFKQLNLNTQKDKIRRYLYQKGYPFSLIQQALTQIND